MMIWKNVSEMLLKWQSLERPNGLSRVLLFKRSSIAYGRTQNLYSQTGTAHSFPSLVEGNVFTKRRVAIPFSLMCVLITVLFIIIARHFVLDLYENSNR